MAGRTPIRIEAAGILRAQFRDSSGEPIQASGVEVLLYEPGLYPGPDLPTVSGLVPTYLGNGTYQLEITAQAPGGGWIDHWRGYILGSLTTVNLSYEVLSGGIIDNYPTLGPCENNLIEVTLSSGIRSLDGVPLGTEFSFFFTTQYSPLYADARKARLHAGSLLSKISDFTLYMALLEASIEADCITFVKPPINTRLYEHARREYVACKAALLTAMNVAAGGGVLKSKRLADFSVEYNIEAMADMISDLMDTCKRWEGQVQAGGGVRAVRQPSMTIKGELDPDRPIVGRGWGTTLEGDLPIGNAKHVPSGSRRSEKISTRNRPSRRGRSKRPPWGEF